MAELGDFRFAVRTLRKTPAFTAMAIITIALGIGTSTAIFSVVNAVLLRPLPYVKPNRLVIITNDLTRRNVKDFPVAAGDVFDIRKQLAVLDGVAALSPGRAPITSGDGPPELIFTEAVTTNLFQVLGAKIAIGRDFTEDNGVPPPPQPPVVPGAAPQTPPQPVPPQLPTFGILSNAFWKTRFGGNPNIVGSSIDLGANKVQIVGVLSPEFEVLLPPNMNVEPHPALYTAARADFENGSRQNVQWRVIGRLKDGVGMQETRAQFDVLSNDLRKRFPVKESAGTMFRVEPMAENLVAEVRPSIVALMGGVIFVLLIACANVANLLLVRGTYREREFAVRSALGGSRSRLVRQMLAESFLLAGIGAFSGLAVAKAGIDMLMSIGPADLPRLKSVSIDPAVLGFTVVAAVFAAAIFGLAPAIKASQPRLGEVLRAGGRSIGIGAGRWIRNSVVVAEVALSLVLLIGAGLMLRSFMALQRVDPGFNPQNVLTFIITNTRIPTPDARQAFLERMHDKLAAIPGVRAVTQGIPLPLDGTNSLVRWGTDAAASDPNAFQQGIAYFVPPGYFETLGTPLIAGRLFTAADNVANRKVVIIDDLLASMAFPNQPAVGKRLLARINTEQAEFHEVIGVVKHQRHTSLATPGEEALYVTSGYNGFPIGRWAVRTGGDPAQIGPLVREAIKEINPAIIIAEMKSMQEFIDKAQRPTRFALMLVGVFGAVAAVLAAVGLYGVVSTSVSQRTSEIGVRMTFGASRLSIFRLILGQGLGLSGAGIVIGLVAAIGLTRAMATMLVGVQPTDSLTFASIAGLFVIIAAIASWVPARRAAGLDPSTALREE